MIDELLKVGGAKFLVPCVFAVILVALAKGLFGIHQSRRAARKDFLDLWVNKGDRDELWRQTAIRHLFGAWLPMPVIRQLMMSSESGCAFVEICGAWDFLEFDEATQSVNWKVRYRKAWCRRIEIGLFYIIYFVFFMLGIVLAFYTIKLPRNESFSILWWTISVELVIYALIFLSHAVDLKSAHKAVQRWLIP